MNLKILFSPSVNFFILLLIVQSCLTFDLATLISKGPTLPLEKLKTLVSPEMLQKFLESKGLTTSAESLRNADPIQIQSLLSRLVPTSHGGRLDPRLLEILRRSLSSLSESSGRYPSEVPLEPSKTKFSSKFKRGRPGNSRKRTTPLNLPVPTVSSATEIYENPDGTLQFDRIDPNIRNHKLYGWRNQNFTTIDRNEDLMMDEAGDGPPALISLSSDPAEPATKSGHWEPPPQEVKVTEETTSYDQLHIGDPLRMSDETSTGAMTSQLETAPSSPSSHFRPSPVDNQGPSQMFTPNRDHFPPPPTALQGQGQGHEEYNFHTGGQSPQNSRRPHFYQNTKQNRMSQYDPTLVGRWDPNIPAQNGNAQGQGQSLGMGIPVHGSPIITGHAIAIPSETKLNYQYILPNHFPPKRYKDQGHLPKNQGHRPGMYPSRPHHHHGAYQHLTPASDKVDSGWSSSTLFLLGGIVAASALAAFVIPSLMPAATSAGKENEVLSAAEANNDFWNEVKGLYKDLTHLANGDLTHFELPDHLKVKHKETLEKHKTSPGEDDLEEFVSEQVTRRSTTEQPNSAHNPDFVYPTANDFRKDVRRGSGRLEETLDEAASLATPIFHQISSSSFSGPARPYFGVQRPNGTMTEWVKLQLQVSE